MAKQQETAIVDIIINGANANSTIKQLNGAARQLKAELNQLPKGSQEFIDKAKRFKEISKELEQVKSSAYNVKTAFQRFMTDVKGYSLGSIIGNAATSALSSIGGFVTGAVAASAKLSDELAEIQRVTGMTKGEVAGLNGELKKIDTRTATTDLRTMAAVAGQFGVAKEDIAGFVAAMDKANVVMGSEFGGSAEEVAKTLAGLRNVLTDTKTGSIQDDLLRIANAETVLAQEGIATAPVISDLANRIGGYGIQAGLSSGQVLGLSASMQELNISTERGGTAMVRILQKMLTNTQDFADIAGVKVGEFTNLLNTDLFGAFMKVVEGSKQGGTAATAMASILKDMGIEGVGASEVFSKFAANQGLVHEKVNLATGALTKQDSIMEQFALKNETAAAKMEKFWKAWDRVIVAPIGGFFATIASGFASVVTPTVKLSDAYETLKKESEDLEKTLNPLMAKYEALKGKTELNKDEQVELKETIKKIGELVPTAVTEWDKYGDAMDVNAGKVRAFTKDQKDLMAHNNKAAIKENEAYIKSLTDRIKLVEQARDKSSNSSFIKQQNKEVKALTAELRGYELALKSLKGEDLGDKPTTTTTTTTTTTGKIILTDEQIAEAEKKLKEFNKNTLKLIEDNAKSRIELMDDEFAKQIELAKLAYDSRVLDINAMKAGEAEKNDALLLARQELHKKTGEIAQKAADDEKKMLDKQFADLEEWVAANEEADKEIKDRKIAEAKDALERINEALMTDEEREIARVRKLYGELIALGEAYGIDVTALRKKMADEIAALESDSSKKTLKLIMDNWQEVADGIMGIVDQINQMQTDKENYQLHLDKKASDAKIKNYDKLLASKRMSQKQYDAAVDMERKAMEAKEEAVAKAQFERNKKFQIANALISGASAVMRIAADVPKIDYGIATGILIGAQVALTAAQVAAITSQKYAVGGYTGNGYGVADSTGFKPAGIVHQGEYVVPQWMMNKPAVANTVGVIEAMRVNRTVGYADGGYTKPVNSEQLTTNSGFRNVEMDKEVAMAIREMKDVVLRLHKKLDEPIEANAWITNSSLVEISKQQKKLAEDRKGVVKE